MNEPTHSPEVTVIILVYNDPVLVKRAMASVCQQTYPHLRIKILDNGSTDSTPAVIKEFQSDPRVEIITNAKNQRSEFAAKIALQSSTKYLSFLFSDDTYLPQRISEMVTALESQPDASAVFSSNTFTDENGGEISTLPPTVCAIDVSTYTQEGHLGHFFTRGNSLHPCAMLIRTADYRELGGFKTYLHRIGDMTFFTKLLTQKKVLFLANRLQNISLLTSNRNESYSNAINRSAVAFERLCFLRELRSPLSLMKLESIFPELSDRVDSLSDLPTRLFWLGHTIFSVPTLDHRLSGMDCMYQAYDQNSEGIDTICNREFGMSFPQLSYQLQQAQISRIAVFAFKLRNFVIRSPGGKLLIDALRPAVKSIRAITN